MNNFLESSIAGIPCIQINSSNESKGIILLYHGWVSSINDYVFLGSLISSWGYMVIIPEIPYHGARGKLNYFDPLELQQYYWSVVVQAVDEARQIISELNDNIVAVIGHSAGGFIAGGIFANNVGIKSAIVINGSCAWVRFEEHICELEGREPWRLIDRDRIRKFDPVSSLEYMRGRSMLILHGAEDTTISIMSQRYFMHIIREENLLNSVKFVEYSRVNHHITLSMLEEAKRWLLEQSDI
ncbi:MULTISPECIES: alpha/beta hydrolase family protein [Paenibacillus]|uniref:alpha/beta hydrolase family protein n=1 Tax=Paenibacillus TaxID=44249 RepID=UPI000B8565BB|nr:prolyl oligopeptidase family serine peptidase [Paenibacillus amylolyticus]